jgi:hypothetical protein
MTGSSQIEARQPVPSNMEKMVPGVGVEPLGGLILRNLLIL